MKITKLFSRLIAVFGLAMMFAVLGWGDGGSNDGCNGELISELHSISATTSRTEPGTLYDGAGTDDDDDYYYFTPGVAGTLSISSYAANESTDLYISTVSCGDNQVLNNGTSYSTTTPFSVGSTNTVYIRVKREKNNASTTYSIPMTFTPTVVAQTPPTLSLSVPNQYLILNTAMTALDFDNYFTATNGDALTYTLAGTLPAGLNYNTTTHAISGTPTALTAETSFTVTATDNDGDTSDVFTITVSAAAVNYTCANPRTFASAMSVSLYGNSRIIGNTNMCKNVNGVCGDPGTARNNDINMMYSDPDGSTNTTTFNSSSAKLDIPDGATVRWAKLYWQGYLVGENDTVKASSKSVKFALPGQALQTIDSSSSSYDYNWIYFTSDRYYYQGSADVTALVQGGGEGNYTVANIVSESGQPIGGSYGAWALVIVYDDPNETFRNVTVFDGYQGIVTSGDQTTAATYASTNGCSTNTGARNTMTIPLSGFLTPKSGTVNSSLSVFAGEGDKGATGDHLALTDSNGVSRYVANGLNPFDDIFNSTITYNGATVTNTTSPVAITPWYSANSNGSDIDTFNVSTDKDGNTLIGNNQTSTNVTLDTSGDGYMPGVFAFSTELYTPNFCYDYGYEQNGISFTEENNGTQMPRVSGSLANTSDINVSIYIKNQENSDISANNVQLNINNIDDTQASYTRDSVSITFPNQYIPISKADSVWPLSVSDTYVRNIPLGNIGGSKYAYTYYALSPNAAGDINMSIDGTFSYDLAIPLPDGTTLTLPYSSTIGGARLPMCSSDNFSYTPVWGIFSVVDAGLYDSAAVNRYYNLTTQVAKRPANLRIASFDATLIDTPKPISTTVAVELIDASPYHDVDAACHEPSSAITPRVWVTFDGNVTQVDFNRNTINAAIANGAVSDGITGATTLASAEDFFKTATSNAAYRVSFNVTNDGNESLIQTAVGTPSTNTQILNFTQLVQDIQHCSQPVEMPSNPSNTTTLVSVACGNAGNQGIDKHHLAICMECLYGYNTNILCSRDNFAIRPESYNVKLNDVNNTTNVIMNSFATDRTGVVTPNTARVNMAGGYIYNYEINATNHVDNTNTPGYTRFFNGASNDYNITLVWEPATAPSTAGCNDTNSTAQAFFMGNGAIDANGSLDQVGEYRLNIIDKTWTAVDWDSSKRGHQTGSHFLTEAECIPNSNGVPLQATTLGLAGTALTNRVGCDIGSAHDNIENNLKYRDYLMTFNPHHFNMNLTYGLGKTASAVPLNGGFVYDSDLNATNDMNMSVRSTGTIRAVGFGGGNLSNFVSECYAKDLNVTLDHNATLTLATPFVARMIHYDANDTSIQTFDSEELIVGAGPFGTVDDSNFTKNAQGAVGVVLRFNYDRNITTPLNPQSVAYMDINVSCTVNGQCSRQADGVLGDANGSSSMDFNVTHGYGRYYPTNIKVYGNSPFRELSYMEVFNAPTINGIGLTPSRFNTGWFINNQHTGTNLGEASIGVLESSGANNAVDINATISVGNANYLETSGAPFTGVNPPYRARAHVNTEGWLWHGMGTGVYADPVVGDSLAQCNNHPCFYIDVLPVIGRAGSAETDGGSKSNKSSGSTNETGWQSTSEYAPAIR